MSAKLQTLTGLTPSRRDITATAARISPIATWFRIGQQNQNGSQQKLSEVNPPAADGR